MSYDSNTSLDRALELAKKRAAQFATIGGDNDSSPAKRHGGGGPELYLKLLIPGFVTGHVIGRGGETIAELRRTSGAYVKMSKNNEFFPGTQDRVGLISGPRDAIADVVQLLNKKIKERLEEVGERDGERYRSIKIVVPSSTVGMIIGKGGETVAEMRQRSGSAILMQKKAPEEKLAERMITLIGEPRSNEIALDMILEKIADDPNSGSCQELSYSDSGSAPGTYGSRSEYGGSNASTGGATAAASAAPGYDTINVNGHTNLRLQLNMHAPIAPDPWVSSQAMPHINYSLRQAGHSDTVADELTRALGLLAAHGVLQLSQSAATQAVTTGWAGEAQSADTYSNSAYGYGSTTAAQPAPPGGHRWAWHQLVFTGHKMD